jgi:hypothetical protein
MNAQALQREWQKLAERNQAILHTDEGKGRTIEESAEIEAEFTANNARLKAIQTSLAEVKAFGELESWAGEVPGRAAALPPGTVGDDAGPRRQGTAKSIGRALVESDEYKAFAGQLGSGDKVSEGREVASPKFNLQQLVETYGDAGAKALVGGGSTSGGAFFRTDYSGLYVPYVQPTLTVRDLVINATTDADIIEFTRAVAHTNAAAEAPEATNAGAYVDGTTITVVAGGLKPEGAFTWEKVTQNVQPIAEGVPVTRRALMNAGQMASIIDDQLRFDIQQRINSQMIAGNGTSPNIRGIRNTTGILTQAFSGNLIETLRKAKRKVTDTATGSGRIPNGAVLEPAGMEALDLFRVGGSTTTDGPFMLNPFNPERNLWGMALVEDPGMTASKAVVGYFRDAVLWDRQNTTVEAYSQYMDFPRRNLVWLQAEWWGTFGVLQPKSFVDVSTV